MTQTESRRPAESLIADGGWAPLSLAIAFITLVGVLAVLRVPYPFALEWMESGAPEHVARVLAGKSLYVAPTIDFVPFLYPPLYYYLAALPAALLGVGLPVLRLISVAASAATIVMISDFVRRVGGSRFAGVVAAGLYAASFQLCGAWFDLARVDAVFVACLVAAACGLGLAEGVGGIALAGALLGLAFLAKQTALIAAVPFFVAALLRQGKRGLIFIAAALATGGLGAGILQATSGGWFGFYLFGLLGGHHLVQTEILSFWTDDLLKPMAIAAAAGLYALADPPARPGVTPGAMRGYLLATGAGLVGLAYAGRLNTGGYQNVLMPAFAYLALLSGLGIAGLKAPLLEALADPHQQLRRRAGWCLHLALCLQFAVLVPQLQGQVPTSADRAAGDALAADLARRPGPVWLPYHLDVLARAGKPETAHAMAIMEVLRNGGPLAAGLKAQLAQAFREKRYPTVVLDAEFLGGDAVRAAFADSYRLEGSAVTARGDVFYPVTGMQCRPTSIHVPR